MSQTHLQIRSDIVQADKSLVQQTLNELIRIIIDFNFADNDYPTIRFYEEEDIDMQLVQRDQILSQIITFTPQYIKKTYGFTDEDFAMKTAEFAESTPKPAQLDTLSEFAEKVINLAMEKIKAGNSLDEVLQSITDLYPGLPREDLENYMSNAIFLAEAGGMLRV
jgi:phage gp29-like protein